MIHNINTVTIEYIGNEPYIHLASNHKKYIFNTGDIIIMDNNHYARYLLSKTRHFQKVSFDDLAKKPLAKKPQVNKTKALISDESV